MMDCKIAPILMTLIFVSVVVMDADQVRIIILTYKHTDNRRIVDYLPT